MARLADTAGVISGSTPATAGPTLHGRVMRAALTALAFSLAVGAAALVWDARRSVDAELSSAMASAAQAIRSDQQDVGASPERLVRIFDGNRHVRAILLDRRGVRVIASHPYASGRPPPAWFV